MQSIWNFISFPISVIGRASRSRSSQGSDLIKTGSRQMDSATGAPIEGSKLISSLDMIKEQTRILIKEIIYYLSLKNISDAEDLGVDGLGLHRSTVNDDKIRFVVRHTVDRILKENENLMRSAVDSLNVESALSSSSSTEVFEMTISHCFDGDFNWGRIMSACTFAGLYAKRLIIIVDVDSDEDELEQQQQQQLMELFADSASRHLSNFLAEWILHEGGWENFAEKFSDVETFQTNKFMRFLGAVVRLGSEFILRT